MWKLLRLMPTAWQIRQAAKWLNRHSGRIVLVCFYVYFFLVVVGVVLLAAVGLAWIMRLN